MTRNAHTVQIKRNAPGSYTITVDGITRGEISKVADGWAANYCNTYGEYNGGASWASTKREIVTMCCDADWS